MLAIHDRCSFSRYNIKDAYIRRLFSSNMDAEHKTSSTLLLLLCTGELRQVNKTTSRRCNFILFIKLNLRSVLCVMYNSTQTCTNKIIVIVVFCLERGRGASQNSWWAGFF